MVFTGTEQSWKKYKCQTCSNSYATLPTLQRHERDQHADHGSIIRCSSCSKIFKNLSSLDTHKRAVHGIRKRQSVVFYKNTI